MAINTNDFQKFTLMHGDVPLGSVSFFSKKLTVKDAEEAKKALEALTVVAYQESNNSSAINVSDL